MTPYYKFLKLFPLKQVSNKNYNKLTILDVCSWAEGHSWPTCCYKLIFRNFHQNGGFSDQVACVWFVMWAAVAGGGKCTYKWVKERELYSHLWSWFMLIDIRSVFTSDVINLINPHVYIYRLMMCSLSISDYFAESDGIKQKKSLHSLCLHRRTFMQILIVCANRVAQDHLQSC